MNQVQMRHSVIGKWQMGGRLHVPLSLISARGWQLECRNCRKTSTKGKMEIGGLELIKKYTTLGCIYIYCLYIFVYMYVYLCIYTFIHVCVCLRSLSGSSFHFPYPG